MKGRLQDRSLEALFRDFHSRGASGVLTLTRGPVKKQICLVKGIVRFAASNLRDDRLGEFLIRSWALPEDVVRGAEAKLGENQRIGQSMLDSGALSPEELHAQVREHILDVVVPCFEWRDGEYRFQDGVPNIVGEMTSDIPVLEFALERARRQVSGSQIEKILSKSEKVLALSGPASPETAHVKMTPAESFVLARTEAGTTLGELLRLSPEGEYEIAQATAVLESSGIVSLEDARPGELRSIGDTLPPGMKPRAREVAGQDEVPPEVRYYKQMYDLFLGADHYKTLSVEHDASVEEVRHAYYRLAKEIHPDRFLAPPLNVLHQEMEELFSQVREAYTTLGDADARARYDAERAAQAPVPRPGASDQQTLARQNYIRGRILFEENKMAEALKFLQNAVDVEPNKAEYRRLLATVQARNPRLRREAETHFLKAIELDPARADTYLQLGLLYRRMGDTTKAVERLRECLKWDPANADAGAALAELASGASSRG